MINEKIVFLFSSFALTYDDEEDLKIKIRNVFLNIVLQTFSAQSFSTKKKKMKTPYVDVQ
jgi:hypothetical protein